MFQAIVREPSFSFVGAINRWYAKENGGGQAIDQRLAKHQHGEYVRNLRDCGVEVVEIPADERFPDGCFVQDPILVLGGQALRLTAAKESRRGEDVALLGAPAFRGQVAAEMGGGFCDGGDVMVAADAGEIWIGISERTDEVGFRQVSAFCRPLGFTVRPVRVTDCLHLITGASYLRDRTVLISPSVPEEPFREVGYRLLRVPPEEKYAANVLTIGNRVIMPQGFSGVREMLRDEGFEVIETPMSEFRKADGSVTCLSNILRR